jgi:hypothetical protein
MVHQGLASGGDRANSGLRARRAALPKARSSGGDEGCRDALDLSMTRIWRRGADASPLAISASCRALAHHHLEIPLLSIR